MVACWHVRLDTFVMSLDGMSCWVHVFGLVSMWDWVHLTCLLSACEMGYIWLVSCQHVRLGTCDLSLVSIWDWVHVTCLLLACQTGYICPVYCKPLCTFVLSLVGMSNSTFVLFLVSMSDCVHLSCLWSACVFVISRQLKFGHTLTM